MTVLRPIITGATRLVRPSFSAGVTGGSGGTVTDGGQPGRVTLTLSSSTQSDPSDGCWISWPARDVLGRPLPAVQSSLAAGVDMDEHVLGMARIDEVTPASLSGELHVYIGVHAVQNAATPFDASSAGYGNFIDYTGASRAAGNGRVRGVSGWSDESSSADAGIRAVMACGHFLYGGVGALAFDENDRFLTDRPTNLAASAVTASQDASWRVVVAAWGTSSTDSVTVDVSYALVAVPGVT